MRKILIFLGLCLPFLGYSQQPKSTFTLGYTAGQSVPVENTDTFQVSFSGGSPFPTQWKNANNDKFLLGFRHNVIYAQNAFTKGLFASKGYFADYVELRWEVERYESQISRFKISRRELGSTEDFEFIASVEGSARSWKDEYAESGQLYEYKLLAEGIHPSEQEFLNFITGIGFRIPYGRVSGRVTYKGGSAVPDVNVVAEPDDDAFRGNSLSLNGTDAYLAISPPLNDPHFELDEDFTFQAWFKAESSNQSTLFHKGNQYKLVHENGKLTFHAGNENVILNFEEKQDTFFHVTAMKTTDSLKLVVVYDEQTDTMITVPFTGSTPSNNDEFIIGMGNEGFFNGKIDELRIWRKSFTNKEIKQQAGLFIDGTEKELSAYYRMNENVGDVFFDLSREGFSFNEKHGAIRNATWSDDIPNNRQISVKGITDENGNYIISGIPYSSTGTNYNITPIYQVHEFDPNQKLFYFGPGANVFNNVDFTDIASFPVKGEVYYEGTFFPVAGVSVKIDGRTAVNSDGQPIVTDATGKFDFDIPIGRHSIQFEKHGHTFKDDGRFPADPDELFDFQQPYTFQQRVIDETKIKVVGKVVGGPKQAAKPIGQGKTENNIGHATIELGTQREYDLAQGDTSGVWNNEYYKAGELKDAGSTEFSVASGNERVITINPDKETGEFVAYLLPEKYVINSIKAGDYTYPSTFHSLVDLSNAFNFTTEVDSVELPPVIKTNGDTLYTYRVDSVQYQHNLDLIYREVPSIEVTNTDGEIAFWEREIELEGEDGEEPTILSLVDDSGNPLTNYPIFNQRGQYELEVSVFEKYINADNGNKEELVPVTDGVVEIQNALATNDDKQKLELDNFGKVKYKFTGGLPNLTASSNGDNFSYTKTMSITSFTGNNQSITTEWNYNGETFRAYLLGGIATGNNFVTTGPDEINMVLRDPPGTNSYSFLEEGSTSTMKIENNFSLGVSASNSVEVDLGTELTTFAGLGAGVITTNETILDIKAGVDISTEFNKDNTWEKTVTNTQRWETSSSPSFVGEEGDVYIGNSTNIVYGLANFLKIIPKEKCPVDQTCLPLNDDFSLGLDVALRINPEFGTAFQFTQSHIENYLIPNFETLRNIFLKNSTNYSSIYSENDEKYGSNNTDAEVILDGSKLTIKGDSYKYTVDVPTDENDDFHIDSVRFYNQQIQQWKNILAQNETEKIISNLEKNVSFDAGSIYESSQTVSTSNESVSKFNLTISPFIATKMGFSVLGMGTTVEMERRLTISNSTSIGTTEENSTTFGYHLEDEDEGNYYSVDIHESPNRNGTIFKTRGGQSSCPYEGETVTQYYQPGKILSAATQRIEVPQITVSNAIVSDIPEDKPAIFNIQLGNVSETGDEGFYTLIIDEQSNQNGATIKMDGTAINNGRVIFIPAGESVNKVITIEKTRPDEFKYEDIGLILHSNCQYDPGDPREDIADTVKISATFQPVCTSVNIENVLDKWVINSNSPRITQNKDNATDYIMNLRIRDYDLSNENFEKIQFQYKPTSTSAWKTDMIYYVNQAEYDAANEPKTFIDNQSFQDYQWKIGDLQDRDFDIRALTVCANNTFNSSDVLSGIKDTKKPKLFGTPQPGDGILSPGDDVMITFDEDIQGGLLLGSNFSVRGVLNGAEIRHNSALFFDGIDDHANILAGSNIANKSFTIEFWTRRAELKEGTIFSKGDMEFGFNASNQFEWTIGDQVIQSDTAYTDVNQWLHFTVSYDVESNYVELYVNGKQMVVNVPLTDKNFYSDGRIVLGKGKKGHYAGFLHELRIWEKKLPFGTIFANMLKSQSGSEIGLLGLWQMDEANGSFALDKAKNHHASLEGASWRVFPSGYAVNFNGTSDHLDIPTSSSVIVTDDMDMTLEFWFRGEQQANTVLFSNGKGDGTDPAPKFENIFVIGTDQNGKMYVQNNDTKMTLEDEVFDNEWHHFALVLNRRSNASVYIDNQLRVFEQSQFFGGLNGTSMTLGARRFGNVTTTYDNFFKGGIDELRIWKLARTSKLLEMDMNSKLTGDETGLMAYYPFDKYDINLVLRPTLVDNDYDDQGVPSTLVATSTIDINNFEKQNVPNVKDARPTQNLAFNWVYNGDRIIINVEEQPNLIEKVVLEFTVDRIEDLNENRLASPITWTAFIKKNTVIWDENVLNFEKKLYEELEFEVEIQNIGGVEQSYSVENAPSWLSIDEPTGTLPPDSKKILTFTVDEATNIGDYEESIFLSSDFDFKEKLDFNLKVYETPPNWEVNPQEYQYSMSTIGRLKIDNIFATNPQTMLAAFVNDTCRGIANLEYFEEYDLYEVYLNIHSNKEFGEEVTFKIWNADEGTVHENVTPELVFEVNKIVGTPSTPQIYETNNNYTQFIDLPVGWKWVSFHLNDPNLANTTALMEKLDLSVGDLIKGQVNFDIYGKSGWNGSLSNSSGIETTESYMIKSGLANQLKINGSRVDVENTPINISKGWNWIGFMSLYNMPLTQAMSNHEPTQNDVIKSQYSFAVYDNLLGWIGSLKTLLPGEGYLYYSANDNDVSFIYPDVSADFANSRGGDEINVDDWELTPEKYQSTQSIIGKLETDVLDPYQEYYIGSFVGDECRGIAKAITLGDEQIYFITNHGEQSGEKVSFKLFNVGSTEIYDINEVLEFAPDQLIGSTENPTLFTLPSIVDEDNEAIPLGEQKIAIYPNPASEFITLDFYNFQNNENVNILIHDLTGKTVKEEKGILNPSKEKLNISNFAPGVYFIKIQSSNKTFTEKVIIK